MKKSKIKNSIFLLSVAFAIYLMASLPVSSAQSVSTTIGVNFFAPDGSTRLVPSSPVNITSPSSMVNKKIEVDDRTPPIDWAPPDPSVFIKITPQPGFQVGDIYLIPCVDEKFALQDPTDCIRSIQRNQKTPIKFSSFVDYQASWFDVSNAKLVGDQEFNKQEARLLTFVNIEIKGKKQWFGYWDVIKRTDLRDFTIEQDNDIDSVDVIVSDPKNLNLTEAYIRNKNTIPKDWITKIIPNKISKQPNAQIVTLHSSYLDAADTPDKFAVTKTDRSNIIDTSQITKDFGLVFASTTTATANALTISPKPQSTCGNDAVEIDAGETKENCCRDFPSGCGHPDLICSVDKNIKSDPGICVNKTETRIIARFEETNFDSCERSHRVKLSFDSYNIPGGARFEETFIELDGDPPGTAVPGLLDIDSCNKAVDRNSCISDLAIKNKVPSACDFIPDQNLKDRCRSDAETKKAFGRKTVPLNNCKQEPGGRTECEFTLDRFKKCVEGNFEIKFNTLFTKLKLSDQKTVELKSPLSQNLAVSQDTKSIKEILGESKDRFKKIFEDLDDGISDAKDVLNQCVDIIKTSVTFAYIMAGMSAFSGALGLVGQLKDFLPQGFTDTLGEIFTLGYADTDTYNYGPAGGKDVFDLRQAEKGYMEDAADLRKQLSDPDVASDPNKILDVKKRAEELDANAAAKKSQADRIIAVRTSIADKQIAENNAAIEKAKDEQFNRDLREAGTATQKDALQKKQAEFTDLKKQLNDASSKADANEKAADALNKRAAELDKTDEKRFFTKDDSVLAAELREKAKEYTTTAKTEREKITDSSTGLNKKIAGSQKEVQDAQKQYNEALKKFQASQTKAGTVGTGSAAVASSPEKKYYIVEDSVGTKYFGLGTIGKNGKLQMRTSLRAENGGRYSSHVTDLTIGRSAYKSVTETQPPDQEPPAPPSRKTGAQLYEPLPAEAPPSGGSGAVGKLADTIVIGSQAAQQKGINTVADSLRSFNEAAGTVTQAGLAVCNIAETMFAIHSKIAQALSQMEQFRICTDIQLNSIGTGACNGDVQDPQAAASAAQGCVSNLVSCNNFMDNAGSTLQNMNQQLQTKSQQFEAQAAKGLRIDFSMNARNVDTQQEFNRANEICGRDQIQFIFGGGNPTQCGSDWDITYTKSIDEISSVEKVRQYLGEAQSELSNLQAESSNLLSKDPAQVSESRNRIKISASLLSAKAGKIKDNSLGSGAIQASADLMVSYASQIVEAVDRITSTQLTSKLDDIRSEAGRIGSKINRSQTEQPRSLKQFFDIGYTSFDWKNAASVFNIGEPADGIYTFSLKCPKIQNVNPTYTVTYTSDCDKLRRSGLPTTPKDITADPDSLAGIPTEKLGLQVTGVQIVETTGKVPAKVARDKDAVPTAVIWKTTDVFLALKNSIKATDEDTVVCSVTGAGVNEQVNPDEKEIKLNSLTITDGETGTLVYSCTKTPATGIPTTEQVAVRLKYDTKAAPASITITGVEVKNNRDGKYSIISKFKVTTASSRLKIQFISDSGQTIDLGEANINSQNEQTEDSFADPLKVYYEVTPGTPAALKGKVKITDLDRSTLTAEKRVDQTLAADSKASVGGWKLNGNPIGTAVQEKDFVTIRVYAERDAKDANKYTIKLQGTVNKGSPTSVRIEYADSINYDSGFEVTVPVTGNTFNLDLSVVPDITKMPVDSYGFYVLTNLKISDPVSPKFTYSLGRLDIQLPAAPPPAGGSSGGFEDVDPNTKFKDIPAAGISAGKYIVVLVDKTEKEIYSLSTNNYGFTLSATDRIVVFKDYGNPDSTIKNAIDDKKLSGLKVKK